MVAKALASFFGQLQPTEKRKAINFIKLWKYFWKEQNISSPPWDSTTNLTKDLPSVAGKVFVITGTTSGAGYIAAQCVAKKGGEVVMLNHPSERAGASLEKLRVAVPGAKFVSIPCNLQDLASVCAACAAVEEMYNTIYCLSNNAGIIAMDDIATKDGEARKSTANGLAEKYFGPNGGNLGGDSTNSMISGSNMECYAQLKFANAVFSYAHHNKLKEKEEYMNIKAIAAHPGFMKTSLYRPDLDLGCFYGTVMPLLDIIMFQNAEDGAMGLIKGMMDSDVESGHLYGPKWLKGTPVSIPLKPFENDTASKKMLRKTSENAIGEKFDV